jgi:hypothetical protein
LFILELRARTERQWKRSGIQETEREDATLRGTTVLELGAAVVGDSEEPGELAQQVAFAGGDHVVPAGRFVAATVERLGV